LKLRKNRKIKINTTFENEHEECVKLFKTTYNNEKHRVIILKGVVPDLILVDFNEKKVYGVEIATTSQLIDKNRKYYKSDFDGFVYVKTKDFMLTKPKIVD